MKTKLSCFLIIASLAFFTFSGCRNEPATNLHLPNVSIVNPSKTPNTILQGTIENVLFPKVVVTSGNFSDTAQIDALGKFKFTMHLMTDGYFSLRSGTQSVQIFMSPGDDLNIRFNTRDIFNSLAFEGKGQLPNQYLKNKYQLLLEQALPLEQMFEKSALEYKQIIDSLYIVQKINLDDFTRQHKDLPSFFIHSEQAALLYDRANQLNEYAVASQTTCQDVANTYFNYLDKTNCSDSTLLHIYEYRLFLDSRLSLMVKKNTGSDTFIGLSPSNLAMEKLKTVQQLTKNSMISNYLLNSVMSGYVRSCGFVKSAGLFGYFEQHCTDPTLKDQLLIPYHKYQSLHNHVLAPEANFTDMQGKEYSFTDFRGQFLYVDIWASWCLPCRNESPLFDKLKEKYRHKNISFISLSIDNKTEDWKGFLTNRKSFENQFLVKNVKLFADDYQVNTIPRFLIIDPNGILIDEDAPRPSENKTGWIDSLPVRKKPNV
jgi:thiol-disulfide isomerase/thioredoxin